MVLKRFSLKTFIGPILIMVTIGLVAAIIINIFFPIPPDRLAVIEDALRSVPDYIFWLIFTAIILCCIGLIHMAGREDYLEWIYSRRFKKIFGFNPPLSKVDVKERARLQQEVHQLLKQKAERVNECIMPSSFFKLPTPSVKGAVSSRIESVEKSRQKNMRRLDKCFKEINQAIPDFYEAYWLADLFGFQVLKDWVQYIPG